jgi:hypothetical protein
MEPYVIEKWIGALLFVAGSVGIVGLLVWWVNRWLDGRDRRRRHRPCVMMARPLTAYEREQRGRR